jgi:hypothetical protein
VHFKRDVADAGLGETRELWSGEMPTGSGEQAFAIAGCAEADPTFWRLDDLKSPSPVRTEIGTAAKQIEEADCCLVVLSRGEGKPSVAAVYR